MILFSEAESVIAKVQKLLALAANNPNEHEASAASIKAMGLLEAYNLDMAVIGKTAKGPQGRQDKKRKGGLYGWQRDLWKSVAELNFCVYWSIKGLTSGSTYEHRILGSHVNVIGAEVMAEYLQDAVERLAKVEAKEQGINVFCRPMIAYREGMAKRLSERLVELRRERNHQEAERRAAGGAGSTALVLADIAQTEADLNRDYLDGLEPGTTSQRRAEREARMAAARAEHEAEEEAKKKRRAEDPAFDAQCRAEEAARKAEDKKWYVDYLKKETARQRRAEKKGPSVYRERAQTEAEKRQSLPEFRQGYQKGAEIGLDKQVKKDEEARFRLR